MKEKDLQWMTENYDGYFEILCKAILLDKVKIDKGRIKVESFND
jgi:hypothetical protein